MAQDEEQERTRIHKQIFLEELEKTRGMVTMAALNASVDRSTPYEWAKRDPVFKAAMARIKEGKGEILEDRLFSIAFNGDFKALKYMLEHVHPAYKKRSDVEKKIHIYHHTDPKPSGVAVTVEDLIDRLEEEVVPEIKEVPRPSTHTPDKTSVGMTQGLDTTKTPRERRRDARQGGK